MFWLAILVLLALGVFGAADRIVAHRPDARRLLAQIRPYQGWAGVVGLAFGLFVVIDAVLKIELIKVAILNWIIYLAVGLLSAALGFVLGFGLLGGLLGKNAGAKEKADELYERLAPLRPTLGMTAISTAVLSVILRILN